jgi:pimeloyl-ACP methyl ester carboxylesterase
MTALNLEHVDGTVEGQLLRVAAAGRRGERAPVVALHGFGSTKEDWFDLAAHPAVASRRFLAWDAPGCGASRTNNPSAVSVPFLVRTAEAVLDWVGADRFHLVGHSMGGLTGLLLAARHPDRVLSFTAVEGNLAPEDCFLSRKVLTHAHDDPEAFLDAFVERARRSMEPGSGLYAAGLRAKVAAEVVRPIFASMVELSDGGDLLATFLGLPSPRLFVHGEHNSGLRYLPALAQAGVNVAGIDRSGHWPMYTHPVALWDRIASFIDEAEER